MIFIVLFLVGIASARELLQTRPAPGTNRSSNTTQNQTLSPLAPYPFFTEALSNLPQLIRELSAVNLTFVQALLAVTLSTNGSCSTVRPDCCIYGRYCGQGCAGSLVGPPLAPLDACCSAHDRCIDQRIAAGTAPDLPFGPAGAGPDGGVLKGFCECDLALIRCARNPRVTEFSPISARTLAATFVYRIEQSNASEWCAP